MRTDGLSEMLPLSKRRYFPFLDSDGTEIVKLPVGSERKEKCVVGKLFVVRNWLCRVEVEGTDRRTDSETGSQTDRETETGRQGERQVGR
jgi:hypothetical protein